MFPLPRVIYAISSDGLLFKFLSTVNERFKTPLIATAISGVFAGKVFYFEFIVLLEFIRITYVHGMYIPLNLISTSCISAKLVCMSYALQQKLEK